MGAAVITKLIRSYLLCLGSEPRHYNPQVPA